MFSTRRRVSRIVGGFALLTILASCGDEAPDAVEERAPNLIIIGLDSFRQDHIGAYGNDWIRTPNLDRFAQEGVLFERASSTAPWTLPSFASMATGLLPSEHGAVGGGKFRIDSEAETLAEMLKEQGYQTRAYVAVDWLTASCDMDRGFDNVDAFVEGPVTGRCEQYQSKVLDFVSEEHVEPYFLFVHYYDAHAPYDPPPPFDRMYYDGDEGKPSDPPLDVIYSERNRLERKNPRNYYSWLKGVQDIEFPVKQYAAGITHVDHHVGAFLDGLRDVGAFEDSLVVIIGDHGEHLTEHEIYFSHKFPYAETLDIPFMMRFPKAQYAGQRIGEIVSCVDLVPTLDDYFNLEQDGRWSGKNLMPLIRDQQATLDSRLLFAEHGHGANRVRAVWNERYRLLEFHWKGRENLALYDHDSDPDEEKNVATQFPKITRWFWSQLQARFSAIQEPGVEIESLDQATIERLKALGYLK